MFKIQELGILFLVKGYRIKDIYYGKNFHNFIKIRKHESIANQIYRETFPDYNNW